jgi:hypothetical protein
MGQKMTKLVDEHKKCKQIAKRKTRENNNNWPANPYEQFSQSNREGNCVSCHDHGFKNDEELRSINFKNAFSGP